VGDGGDDRGERRRASGSPGERQGALGTFAYLCRYGAALLRGLAAEAAGLAPRIVRKALLLALAVAAAGLAAAALDWGQLWRDGAAIFASPEQFRAWVRGFGIWAPAVFWLVQVAQVIAAPIPGGLIVVAGTALFGVVPGLALSLSGVFVGSLVLFAAARRWGRPLVSRLVGEEAVQRYAGIVERAGGWWLFLAFLLPFMPDDALVALAGLSGMSYGRFLLLTTLGRLPMMALTGYVAVGVLSASLAVWVAAAVAAALATALALRRRTRLNRWLQRRAGGASSGAEERT
jgi:uncharacterized membrane protein YdjX (TVP38/TMEM64 family)